MNVLSARWGCRGTVVITPTEFVLNCASARHRPHRAHGQIVLGTTGPSEASD
jgi:hypothetical protein